VVRRRGLDLARNNTERATVALELGCAALGRVDVIPPPNMRMQLTRPREQWPAAERWTSASLQLIRGR